MREHKSKKVLIKCDNCGNEFEISPCYLKRERKNRFCCRSCEAEFKSYKNSIEHWRGGHISKSTGYRYITINGVQIEEHRLVMMRQLGRELKSDEVVHHLNGNKLDNRIENLRLMTNEEHAKVHGAARKQIKACVVCGKVGKMHGRGLCNSCYYRALTKGELAKYAKVCETIQESGAAKAGQIHPNSCAEGGVHRKDGTKESGQGVRT